MTFGTSWELYVMIRNADLEGLQRRFADDREEAAKIANKKFKQDSILAIAIKFGNLAVVETLLQLGASLETKSYENGRWEPPLLTATRMKSLPIVRLLTTYGANVRQSGFYGFGAIYQAVSENAFDILDFYLSSSSSSKTSSSSLFIHEKPNCPRHLAIKASGHSACKRKSLSMLIGKGYSCACFVTKEPRIIKNSAITYCAEVYGSDDDNDICILCPLTLANLSTLVIRHSLLLGLGEGESNQNFMTRVMKLPLPTPMQKALLFDNNDKKNYLVCLKENSEKEPKIWTFI